MTEKRRKRLSQSQVDAIREDYEAWASGDYASGNETVYGIARKHGVSTPTVHDLRNKGWVVGGKNRPTASRIEQLERSIMNLEGQLHELNNKVGDLSLELGKVMQRLSERSVGCAAD